MLLRNKTSIFFPLDNEQQACVDACVKPYSEGNIAMPCLRQEVPPALFPPIPTNSSSGRELDLFTVIAYSTRGPFGHD